LEKGPENKNPRMHTDLTGQNRPLDVGDEMFLPDKRARTRKRHPAWPAPVPIFWPRRVHEHPVPRL